MLLSMLAAAQTPKKIPAAAPEQPIPFSHEAHAGTLKLQCRMCHPNPDPGEAMRIAAGAPWPSVTSSFARVTSRWAAAWIVTA